MAFTEDERANLTAYLDGELDDESSQAIEAKIGVDAEARAEMEQLRQTWSMLDFLPRALPSPDFTNKTMEKLSLERMPTGSSSSSVLQLTPIRSPSRWKAIVGWAAAVLVSIGLGVGAASVAFRQVPGDAPQEPDEALLRNLRTLEKWRQYEAIEDLEFLQQLDHPELFGDDAGT